MEHSINGAKADAPFVNFTGAQRETGEVLIEGAGTMEITATEGGGLKRMDVTEASPYLRSLAHFPPQAAFRYHRQPSETPTLALEWVRFPDSSVLAAVAENAEVTTLVTSEGKSLTEVKLTLKNQAQPFLKVGLPAGATILSADVGGERVCVLYLVPEPQFVGVVAKQKVAGDVGTATTQDPKDIVVAPFAGVV